MNHELQSERLDNWQAALRPEKKQLFGNYCVLKALDVNKHAADLWSAYALDTEQLLWRYLPYGPFANERDFFTFLQAKQQDKNTVFYAVVNCVSNQAAGVIAYSRIAPEAGSIEIAHLCFSPLLQKSTIATEAVYLMIKECFGLGYRRCEWKCNTLNQASKNAARRFGFQYEGCFRQATVIKGYNRDTDWFSIIDKEWPPLNNAYQQWLSTDNFYSDGKQRKSLRDFKNSSGEY